MSPRNSESQSQTKVTIDSEGATAPQPRRPGRPKDVAQALHARSDANAVYGNRLRANPSSGTYQRNSAPKVISQTLRDSRPAPRHRHAVDAPGTGPMAPRGATSRAPHRVFPVAPSHAQGVVLLGPQRRLFHDGPEVDAGLHVRVASRLVVRILPATKAPRRSQRTPFQNPPRPTAPSPT